MQTHERTLSQFLRKQIERGGCLSVADFMQQALTHPELGYYTRKDPLGAQGDFITAPEISQVFGELIGLWLAEQWHVLGQPETTLAELGPGRGTLMKDILRATKNIAGFHDAISIHLVETSPVLQQKQQQTLASAHPRISWHKDISEIPAQPLLLVANEFFDALPIRQFIYEQGAWRERVIDLVNGKFMFVTAPMATPSPPFIQEKLPLLHPVEGTTFEYSEPAAEIARNIAEHIAAHGGAAIVIDYGYEGANGNTLQAVRSHKYHDVLADPGLADITAHVDFGLLKYAAKNAGASTHGPVSQGVFLSALGAELRTAHLCQGANDEQKRALISGLERLTSPEQMGELFKVLAITSPNQPKPEGF